MTEWKKNLSKFQEIIVRAFLTLAGMAGLIIAFYAVSLEKLLKTDKDFSLDAENYIIAAVACICIWAAFDLGRFAKIVGFIGQKFGYKKPITNTKNHRNDAE